MRESSSNSAFSCKVSLMTRDWPAGGREQAWGEKGGHCHCLQP